MVSVGINKRSCKNYLAKQSKCIASCSKSETPGMMSGHAFWVEELG